MPKKITTPNVETILDLTEQEMRKIMAIELEESEEIECEGSTFIGFTTVVESYIQVQDAYTKLKLLYPDARHIVCAYVLPGVDKYYCEDFCDDEEYNGGRTLLRILQVNNIVHRAVYVVQFYNGKKIGERRFECMKQAVQQAVAKTLVNPFTHKVQRIELSKKSLGQRQPLQNGGGGKNSNRQQRTYSEITRGGYRGGARGRMKRVYHSPTRGTAA